MVATWSGKVRKSRKVRTNKENDKSQVKRGFLKKVRMESGKNSKKHQNLSVQVYQNPYI